MGKVNTSILKNQFSERKNLNICLPIVEKCRNRREMPALATYYFLKIHFRNSCIYNFRPRMAEIATLIGISQKTLYTYLSHLRRLELIREHSGNLIFESTAKLKKQHKQKRILTIKIDKNETIKDIESRLYGKLLERHVTKLAFHRSVKKFENNLHDLGKAKYDENGSQFSISVRNMMKLLSVSQLKAKAIINSLNMKDIILTQSRKAKYLDYGKAPLKYSLEFPGHYFNNKRGFLFIQFGQQHELIAYPCQVRNLTYRQYLRIRKNLKNNLL